MVKVKNVVICLFCIILLFSFSDFSVAALVAEKPSIVYTTFIGGGNFIHSGDGTLESPFNLFEDALEAVADGGTIYIPHGSAFVNSEGYAPLQINKNVIISSLPGADVYPELSVRTTGIVLGSNVTFKNIVLSFSNCYRPVVCANGYTLTMENVSYSSNARIVHLAGGGMRGRTGDNLSPVSGPRSRIIINGQKTNLGNIYGGGINDSFDKDVDIVIEGIYGNNIGTIYSSGAEEGYYNDDNFLDPDNEPEQPTAIPNTYPVSGNVSIDLIETGIQKIDGETGGKKNADVSVSTIYRQVCDLGNIYSLKIKQGNFVPGNKMENGVNISIEPQGILDLSNFLNYQIGDFAGGGMLILKQDGCLTIQGECTGETEFRTEGGYGQHSGLALYDHLYITTDKGNGIFSFNPYPTQNGMTLQKCAQGWRTSVRSEQVQTVLTKFEINSNPIFVSTADINSEFPPEIEVNVAFAEDTDEDIGKLPLEYSVTYQGEKYSVKSDLLEETYYEGYIHDLHMSFTPIENVIIISNFSSLYGSLGEIGPGAYDIEITAPVGNNYVTQLLKLVVFEVEGIGENFTEVTVQGTPQAVCYNDTVSISAQIKDLESHQAVTSGKATLYINSKEYQTVSSIDENGGVVWELPVTKKDGFWDGVNQITVTYGGNNTYAGAFGIAEISIDTFKINERDGKIDVQFTNTTDMDIENAVLLLALYNDKRFCKVIPASESVITNPNEEQSFSFDVTGEIYNETKLFIWNSIQGMIPIMSAYSAEKII